MCKEVCCLNEKDCVNSCSHNNFFEPEKMLMTYEQPIHDFDEEKEDKLDLLFNSESHAGCTHDHGMTENMQPVLGIMNDNVYDEHRHCKECDEHMEGDSIVCKNCGKINLWT